ncbi:MAG: flagellar assembly protein FliH [Burkholderiales bacterium]
MVRSNNRFIPEEEVGVVSDWNFGAVDQASLRFAAKLKAQEMAHEQQRSDGVRQAGYAEGFTQGHAQATLEGHRQLDAYIADQGHREAQRFGDLFTNAQAQLAQTEQVLAKGVLELACELARQVLRHEMAANPNALQPVIRDALGVLAVDSKAAVVRLNPLDLEVFAEVLRQEYVHLSLTFLSDAAITRGGCLVESAGTVVDGTLEKRWARAVASLGLESSWEVGDAD